MESTDGRPPLYLIVRSNAATHAPEPLREAVEAAGERFAFEPVRGLDEMPRAVGRALDAGYSTLAITGPDAAFSRAADAVLASGAGGDVTLGIVPAGRSHDIAATLGIGSLTTAVDAILSGSVTTIDAARATTGDGTVVTHFVVAAAAGWAPPADGIIRPAPRRLATGANRVAAAAMRLARSPARSFTLSIDGRERDGRYSAISMHNLARWQSGLLAAPGASPRDGLLDVLRWRAQSRRELLRTVRAQIDGTREHSDDDIERSPGRLVELSSPRTTTLLADGRDAGRLPARIEVLPGALRVLVPRNIPAG